MSPKGVPVLKGFKISTYSRYIAGPRSAVGSASDSKARGPGFDTRSDHILSFLLPLILSCQLLAKECA